MDVQVIGTSFDNLFPLLIHRRNQIFPVRSNLIFEWLSPKQLRDSCKADSLTDVVLNQTIKHAIEKQRSFAYSPTTARPRPSDNLRRVLRLLCEHAEALPWQASETLFRGSFASCVDLDLLIDRTIIEVKTVKDAGHHSEHAAQLFAYYLISGLSVKREKKLIIEKVAIYYGRHGVLAAAPVSALMRFPARHFQQSREDSSTSMSDGPSINGVTDILRRIDERC
ncbi:MAG: hypothetical protein SFY81_02705 [Verrucomicrobiota bacterium]|nr:hypothetical protein [Verrucomicrobiota bacterium]